MTSKTFKSTMTDSRELDVDVLFSNPRLLIKESGNGRSGFVFAPSDAPALALAILEAAGVESAYRSAYNAGSDWQLEHAVNELSEYVRTRSTYEAEALERAELETEALELHNAFWDGMDRNQIDSWGDESGNAKQSWIAAARRAREMRAEK